MNTRINKLNSEFKRMIVEVLTKKIKDPRITELFTVLEVDCDNELSTAKVYVSVYSTDSKRADATLEAIRENEPTIRREISKAMHIRKVPTFEFLLDTSMEYGQRIDKILDEINKKTNS